MKIIYLFLFVLLAACSSAPTPSDVAPTSQPTEPKIEPKSEPQSGPASSTSADRVAAATARLSATDGGRVILRAIEKAGGLENWLSKPIRFRFAYKPLGERPPTDTLQVIDTQSSLARHLVVGSADTFGAGGSEFGWDGAQAWSTKMPADSKLNVRFWSLTPYYFVGMPFVLADPGVVLTKLPSAELEGRMSDLVKVTFESGVGDAPDDYYIVYVDVETSQVTGLRYVVSYKGFFKDGGHSPEKIMLYSQPTTVDGLTVASRYDTYKWVEGAKGEKVTIIEMTDFQQHDVDANFFAVPTGATIQDGL